MSVPGLFFYLCREGLVDEAALAELLAMLPPEEYVRTHVRGGEAFDSTRWPVARDALLASFAARSLGDPTIERALVEIDQAGDDVEQLRALCNAQMNELRQRPEQFDPTLLHLYSAHREAADGLYAYHVHRGLPGAGAEAAAFLVRVALERGRLEIDSVIAMAKSVVARSVSGRSLAELPGQG